jgi:hypothetical protein
MGRLFTLPDSHALQSELMENAMTKATRALDVRLQTNGANTAKGSNMLAARLRSAVRMARTTGPTLRRRSARAVAATRAGLGWTTRRVQTMPSSTSQSLAAGSVGLGAGLFIGGAPRLITATGVAPAVVIGAAILLRPDEKVRESEAAR